MSQRGGIFRPRWWQPPDVQDRALSALSKGLLQYSLAADSGSFAFTGTDASLEFGREIAADPGSFAFSGTDAALEYGREVTADAGSFTINGQDASLELGREITAEAGSFAFTGVDATLERSSARAVVANAGSFAFTGTDAVLDYTPIATQAQPPSYGGGGAPIWSEVSWFKKKKKPKKEELIEEVAAVVEQAVPQVTEDESRAVALRLISQNSYAQLRQMATLEAFVAKVEAELAEIDDEEVLLLAA